MVSQDRTSSRVPGADRASSRCDSTTRTPGRWACRAARSAARRRRSTAKVLAIQPRRLLEATEDVAVRAVHDLDPGVGETALELGRDERAEMDGGGAAHERVARDPAARGARGMEHRERL